MASELMSRESASVCALCAYHLTVLCGGHLHTRLLPTLPPPTPYQYHIRCMYLPTKNLTLLTHVMETWRVHGCVGGGNVLLKIYQEGYELNSEQQHHQQSRTTHAGHGAAVARLSSHKEQHARCRVCGITKAVGVPRHHHTFLLHTCVWQ